MSRRKSEQKKVITAVRIINAEIEQRDGPTEEYKNHYDTISRGGGFGRRRKRRMETLLRSHWITPEQLYAAGRFLTDHENAGGRAGRSCIDISGGSRGNGDGHPPMFHILASARVTDIKRRMDAEKFPRFSGLSAYDLIVMVIVDDTSFIELSRMTNVSEDAPKRLLARYLGIVAKYYADLDKAEGRSSTLYTEEAVLKRLDPEL